MIAQLNLAFGALLVCSFAAAIILLYLSGRRIAEWHRARDPESGTEGLGAIDGAIFGLMGLLIAFTFSGAASRFDDRRQLIADETNAIGTAYLRLDLLPASSQPKLRENFRKYLDARLTFFLKLPDENAARTEMVRVSALQEEIWTAAVAACEEIQSAAVTNLVLSSLNAMIDITTTRNMALFTHPPTTVYYMLGVMVLVSSLLAGYEMAANRTRSWVHVISFTVLLATSVYVIIDLEYPRAGLIRVTSADQFLKDLRQKMN